MVKRVTANRDLLKLDPDDISADMQQSGWEEIVFVHADHFRLHRFYGHGGQERVDVKTWPDALTLAQAEVDSGRRVLVYAITANGRTTVCSDKRWQEFTELWETFRGKKG
jgi:hypothetical protein